MNFRSPRFWIAFLSLTAVFYLALPYFRSRSPGPLATVHQREPKLTGWGSCANCHGGWFGNMTDSCLECHELIAKQMEAGNGLHGTLGKEKASRCALCHSEHHGNDFAMVNRQSFVQAGILGRESFRHQVVGFAMDGRHLEVACGGCHPNADVAVLPEGGRRFVGLAQDCVTCHEDVHKGVMVLPCARCHGQQSFFKLSSQGHEKYLALVGGHGDIACRECHAQEDAHSIEALGGGKKIAPRECASCHESPHRPGFVPAVARLLGKKEGTSCVDCHLPEHTSFRQEGLTVSAELHACSGFPLEPPHEKVACKDCHAPERERFAARYPGRGADDCGACHADAHGGQFDEGPFATQGCIACHQRLHFMPHAFTATEHERAALALTGRHLEAECNDCHQVPLEGGPREFRGTPHLCGGCHSDAHTGFFDGFAEELAASPHGACERCHTTKSFSEIPGGGFDHGSWTGFPIAGAHEQAGCESCHPRTAAPDRFRRTLGWVSNKFGQLRTDAACIPCHKDPHLGDFDGPKLPQEVEGRIGCARCHEQTSFRAFPNAWDHEKWTGFALEGAHAKTGCASCHAPLQEPDEHGRTWSRAKGRQCSSCHEDAHAGQFLVDGRNDCQRCHRTGASFSDLTFRHEIHSRFRLGDAHKGLPCDACHKKVRIGDVEVVRYRPIGFECADCHGEQEDPFRRRTLRR